MTSERWSARALLAVTSFAALGACSVRPEDANAQREATASTVAALDATWPEFTTIKRQRHAGVELGAGRALVCGGKGADENYPPTCELLEVVDGRLTSTVYPLPGNLPVGQPPESTSQPRLSPTLTRLPTGGVLIVGGRPSGRDLDLDTAFASRPIADWQPAGGNPNLNWLSGERLKVQRELHTATLLGTSVVVFGGWNTISSTSTGPIEVRTDGAASGPWHEFVGAQALRSEHTATLLQPIGNRARVLILGGYDYGSSKYLRSGFIFSLENGVEEEIPDMPGSPRLAHTATLLGDPDGSVLVVGGQLEVPGKEFPQAISDAWRYNPVKHVWSAAGATPPRRHHSAVRVGDYVIVAGGSGDETTDTSDGEPLTSVQSYDWKSNTWSDLRSLSQGRAYLQLLKLDDPPNSPGAETHVVASGGLSLKNVPDTSELITLLALGHSSSDAQECASGHQADGVCCESDCNGPCQKCDGAGVCQPLSGMPSSGHLMCDGNVLCSGGACPTQCASTNDCISGFFCDSSQKCVMKKVLGTECNSNAECAKGTPCVGGVCCESECSGPCEACNAAGLCRPIGKDEPPRASHPACPTVPNGDPQCAARCDGETRDRCVFPGSSSTCSASCEGDAIRPASACDGQGACQTVALEQCGAYTCDANQCLNRCENSNQCAHDATCKGHTCSRCNQDACNGFTCDADTDECKHTCQRSETDCAGSYYCHPLEHRCVKAIPFPASQLPACAMGRGRVAQHSFAIAAAAWLLFCARRRRSTATRTRASSP